MPDVPDLATTPLDIQHDTDPAHEVPPARRIPHLGHAAIYFAMNAFAIALGITVAFYAVHAGTRESELQHPVAAAVGQLGGYALTFAMAIPTFGFLWSRSFWQGIHWNPRPVRLHWLKLLGIGIGLSVLAQIADSRIKTPVDTDVVKLFATPLSAWLTTILGSWIPAFAEEIAFRGFLLPSLATAYDWLSLDRTPAGLQRWESTSDHSTGAWAFGAFFTSLFFAGLHGFQLHGSYAPLITLFAVSLAFCAVRIRTQSVAASFFVHTVYNSVIFLEMAVATGGFRHLDKLS